jgi:hypothetical protein
LSARDEMILAQTGAAAPYTSETGVVRPFLRSLRLPSRPAAVSVRPGPDSRAVKDNCPAGGSDDAITLGREAVQLLDGAQIELAVRCVGVRADDW